MLFPVSSVSAGSIYSRIFRDVFHFHTICDSYGIFFSRISVIICECFSCFASCGSTGDLSSGEDLHASCNSGIQFYSLFPPTGESASRARASIISS
jgi:hypothetical protein